MTRRVTCFALVAAPSILAVASSLAAQDFRPHRVNEVDDPFEPDVESAQISPDGEWIVWIQGGSQPDLRRLYSARRWAGSDAIPLTAQVTDTWTLPEFRISPDSKWVVYRGVEPGLTQLEPWVVPIGGGAFPRRLNAPSPDPFELPDFALSPVGPRAIFRSDQLSPGRMDLWSAPLEPSGSATPLHPPPVPGSGVPSDYLLTPGGERVIFLAAVSNEFFAVWSADVTGDSSVQVSASSPGLGPARDVVLSPDGAFAVYLQGDEFSSGPYDVWSVPVDGSGPATLLTTPFGTWRARQRTWIDPTGQRVVFEADRDDDQRVELWSAAIDGGTAPLLLVESDGELAPDLDVVFGADGARAAFAGTHATFGVEEVFSVSLLAPGQTTRLSPSPAHAKSIQVRSLAIGADDRVVFGADFVEPFRIDLYSAPIGGGEPAERLDPTSPDGSSMSWELTSDGRRLVFVDLDLASGESEIWSVPVDRATPPVVLSLPREPGGFLNASFQLDPTGERAVYAVQPQPDGFLGYYAVPIAGPAEASRLVSPEPAPGGHLYDWQAFAPGGLGGLFRGDLDGIDGVELWMTDSGVFGADHEEGDPSEWTFAVDGP